MPYTTREVYDFISRQTSDPIVEWKTCKVSGQPFPIYQSDVEFYDKISPTFNGVKYHIPTPTLCPEERERRRLAFLNQTHLYNNICLKCNKKIISRFPSTSKIKNYCNVCWSKDDRNQLELGTEVNFNKSFFEQISYLITHTPFQNLIGSSENVKHNAVYTNHTSDIHNSYLVSEANK
jgi:hypothetical protein